MGKFVTDHKLVIEFNLKFTATDFDEKLKNGVRHVHL